MLDQTLGFFKKHPKLNAWHYITGNIFLNKERYDPNLLNIFNYLSEIDWYQPDSEDQSTENDLEDPTDTEESSDESMQIIEEENENEKRINSLFEALADENECEKLINILNSNVFLAEQRKKLKQMINHWFESENKKRLANEKSLIRDENIGQFTQRLAWKDDQPGGKVVLANFAQTTDEENYTLNEASVEKKKERIDKKLLSFLSNGPIGFSVALANGGFIAVAFALGAGVALLPAILIIGIPAFLVNYVLFRGALLNSFKDFFTTGKVKGEEKRAPKFLLDDEGNRLTPLTKFFLFLGTILSVGVGAGSALLTFGSIVLALGFTVAAIPLAVGVFAGLLAGLTFVAMTALTYKSLAGTIKNNPLKQIKNFFIKNFGKKPDETVARHITRVILGGLFLVAGAALAVIGTIFLTIVSQAQGIAFFTGCLQMAAKAASTLSTVLIVGIGGLGNGIIYLAGSIGVTTMIKNGVVAVRDFCANIGTQAQRLGQGLRSLASNPVRLVSTVAKTLLTGFLLVCAGFNASGQGDGAHAPSVLPTLKDIFRNLFLRNPSAVGTAVQIAVVAGEISLTANSFTLNGEAILEQSGPAATVRPPLTISRVLSTIANGIHRLAQKLSQAWPLGKEAIIQKMNSLISLADEIADKDNTFNEKAKTSDGYLAIAERIKTLAAKNADYKTELNAETAASLKTEIDTWKKDRTKNGNGGKTNEEILMKTRSLFNNGAANNPNASKTYAIVNNIEKELDSIHSAGLK